MERRTKQKSISMLLEAVKSFSSMVTPLPLPLPAKGTKGL